MQKTNWENGTIVKEAFVTIDNEEYVVTPRQIEGNTPLSADNLNDMEDNIETAIETAVENLEEQFPEDITTDGVAVKCGYNVDGEVLYVKRFNFGSLPNNGSKSVATGIDFSSYTLYKIEGIAKYSSGSIAFPIPFAHPTNLSNSIMVNVDNSNNLVITTGVDRRSYDGYINIYYY